VTERAVEQHYHILYIFEPSDRPRWCGDALDFVCSCLRGGREMLVRRPATAADKRRWRVPVSIQSEEWPLCCGRSMTFVGQLDDNTICMDPAIHAKLWWHDAARFYVLTCSVCLECKAIGQQF
jgi:hypothetical protein